MRKIWCLPNIARSDILPELIGFVSVRLEVMQLFSNMYNIMYNSHNSKMNMLCKMSVYSDKKGIIGQNVSIISKKSSCGFDKLQLELASCDDETKSRALLIKEITLCLEGSKDIENFSREELETLKDYVACY